MFATFRFRTVGKADRGAPDDVVGGLDDVGVGDDVRAVGADDDFGHVSGTGFEIFEVIFPFERVAARNAVSVHGVVLGATVVLRGRIDHNYIGGITLNGDQVVGAGVVQRIQQMVLVVPVVVGILELFLADAAGIVFFVVRGIKMIAVMIGGATSNDSEEVRFGVGLLQRGHWRGRCRRGRR